MCSCRKGSRGCDQYADLKVVFLTFGLHEHLLKGAAETEITRILWLLQSLLSAVTNKNIDFLGAWRWSNLNDPLQQCKNLDISIWKPHYYVKVHFLKNLKVDLLLSYVHWSSAWALNSAAGDIQPGFGFTLVDTVAIEALSTARWTVVMSVLWVSINTESPQCDHDKTCMIW